MREPQGTTSQAMTTEYTDDPATETPAQTSPLKGAYGAFLVVTAIGYLGIMLFVFAFGMYGERLTQGVDAACAEAAFQSGQEAEAQGNVDLAIQRYHQALGGTFAESARRHECGRSVGEALFRLGRYQEAADAYRGLPPEALSKSGHWAGYVTSVWYAGDYPETERLGATWLAMANAENDTQQQVWANYTLGNLYERQKKPRKALQHYQAASEHKPEGQASIMVARMLNKMGRRAEAIEQLDTFLALVPSGELHQSARRLRAEWAPLRGVSGV